MTDRALLEISRLSVDFDSERGIVRVLQDLDLKIAEGEFVTLIGHSGCGKSTLLNCIAGLVRATRGGVILEGTEVTEPGPDRSVVFQNHSLLPWLTVYDNVALAVNQVFKRTKSKTERHEWINHNLELVQMTHAAHLRPHEISGGMAQRVGIARAMSMQPKILLMDEPFGALDALTRAHLQDSLMEIQQQLRNTVIMVTHDVDEAVLLSNRIVMLSNGPAANIGQVLDIDLPTQRNRIKLASDSTFNHCRHQVLQFLYEKQRKVEPLETPVKPGAAEPADLPEASNY